MYERHPSGVSTRYRDLADIVRILQAGPIDAERLGIVLDREFRRRGMPRPKAMTVPSDDWRVAFPQQARTFAEYPSDLYPVEASLEAARGCLDEILAGERVSGTWDHETQKWVESAEDRG